MLCRNERKMLVEFWLLRLIPNLVSGRTPFLDRCCTAKLLWLRIARGRWSKIKEISAALNKAERSLVFLTIFSFVWHPFSTSSTQKIYLFDCLQLFHFFRFAVSWWWMACQLQKQSTQRQKKNRSFFQKKNPFLLTSLQNINKSSMSEFPRPKKALQSVVVRGIHGNWSGVSLNFACLPPFPLSHTNSTRVHCHRQLWWYYNFV